MAGGSISEHVAFIYQTTSETIIYSPCWIFHCVSTAINLQINLHSY